MTVKPTERVGRNQESGPVQYPRNRWRPKAALMRRCRPRTQARRRLLAEDFFANDFLGGMDRQRQLLGTTSPGELRFPGIVPHHHGRSPCERSAAIDRARGPLYTAFLR